MLSERVPALIPRESKLYLRGDNFDNAEENVLKYTLKLPNSMSGSASLPYYKPSLKIVYIVMLLKTLHLSNGHENGAKYIVEFVKDIGLVLHIATCKHTGTVWQFQAFHGI